MIDPKLDDSAVWVGYWKEDLPNSKANNTVRKKGAPAFLKAFAEADSYTIRFKARDAMGGFASIEHIQWLKGDKMAEQDAIDAALKAEMSVVRHVESWNRGLAVYKAREWLVASVVDKPVVQTAAGTRPKVKAGKQKETDSPTSAKRRRLDTAAKLEYLAYEGRIYLALKAMKSFVDKVLVTLDAVPEIGGQEYDLLG